MANTCSGAGVTAPITSSVWDAVGDGQGCQGLLVSLLEVPVQHRQATRSRPRP